LNKDQAYGAVVLIVSVAVAILYLISVSPSIIGLPTWLTWWAIAIPVILAVLAVLTICMWIGWTMLTTPPPPPLEETAPLPTEIRTKDDESKR